MAISNRLKTTELTFSAPSEASQKKRIYTLCSCISIFIESFEHLHTPTCMFKQREKRRRYGVHKNQPAATSEFRSTYYYRRRGVCVNQWKLTNLTQTCSKQAFLLALSGLDSNPGQQVWSHPLRCPHHKPIRWLADHKNRKWKQWQRRGIWHKHVERNRKTSPFVLSAFNSSQTQLGWIYGQMSLLHHFCPSFINLRKVLPPEAATNSF